jgi:hypothetical protein
MKRYVWLCVLAGSLALAGSLPPGKAYDVPVSVEVRAGVSLGDAIRILARSASLSVVVAQAPELQAKVTLDVKSKPFRQVWEGLFMGAARNLDYKVLPSGLIVVAPRAELEAFAAAQGPKPQGAQAPAPAPAAPPAAADSLRDGASPARPEDDPLRDRLAPVHREEARRVAVYPVDDPQTLAPLAQGLLPQSRVFVLIQPRALVVEATESQHQQFAGLLKALAEAGGARQQDGPPREGAGAGPGQREEPRPEGDRPQPAAPATPPSAAPKAEAEPRPAAPDPAAEEAVLLFAAPDAGASLAQALLLRFKEAKVTHLEALKVVMVQLPRALAAEAQDFVRQLEAARPAVLPSPAPAAPVERALPLGYAKAKGVLELVAKLLPESKEVLLAADERTNTVLLRGPAAAVAAIERLVGELDRPVPQVDLQVRVEQITSGQGEDLRAALEAALGPFSLKVDPGSGTAGLGMEVGKTQLLKLDATLKALQSAGKSRSLIDSRFTVSSGESVNLLSGGSLLIPLSSSGSNGGTATTGLQSVEFGLELKLTPAVIPGDKIQLAVSINLGSAPSSGPNNATVIPKQQLTSNVLLTSGHSAVLGGVISSTEQESRSGVPLLMDLPLIGGLFGQTSKSVSQNHLLIVVTAVSRVPERAVTGATPPGDRPPPAPSVPAVPSTPPKPQPKPPAVSAPVVPPGFERDVEVGN